MAALDLYCCYCCTASHTHTAAAAADWYICWMMPVWCVWYDQTWLTEAALLELLLAPGAIWYQAGTLYLLSWIVFSFVCCCVFSGQVQQQYVPKHEPEIPDCQITSICRVIVLVSFSCPFRRSAMSALCRGHGAWIYTWYLIYSNNVVHNTTTSWHPVSLHTLGRPHDLEHLQ